MRLDRIGPSAAGAPLPPAGTDSQLELERLRGECRRQAMQLDTLREAVSMLTRGARALKAENVDLRTENARLRGGPHHNERVEGAELTEVAIPLDVRAPGAARTAVVSCLADYVASSVLENAQLLVSELVTNSLRQSGAPEGDDVVVRVHLWRDMCRLASAWGVIRPPDGPTRVWAQLSCARALA